MIIESEEFIQLQKELLLHKKLYYLDNNPIISDYEYDMLEKKSIKMAENLGFTDDDGFGDGSHHIHWMVGYKEDSVYNQ